MATTVLVIYNFNTFFLNVKLILITMNYMNAPFINLFRGNEKFCSSVDRSIFPISMANIRCGSPCLLHHGYCDYGLNVIAIFSGCHNI